jgi:hypothetical protein
VRSDFNLPIAEVLDQHNITKISDTVVNLDLVLEELLECGNIEDLVASRLRSIDDELSSRQYKTLHPLSPLKLHVKNQFEKRRR